MRIIGVYDNEKTIDRYTVIFNEDNLFLCVSHNCNSPQGFSQSGQGKLQTKYLGKKIKFSELPKHVQKHIKERMEVKLK